jgi:hypothetical protein
LMVRSSLVSGEISPGDDARLSASAIAETSHNQRRLSGMTSKGPGSARTAS